MREIELQEFAKSGNVKMIIHDTFSPKYADHKIMITINQFVILSESY